MDTPSVFPQTFHSLRSRFRRTATLGILLAMVVPSIAMAAGSEDAPPTSAAGGAPTTSESGTKPPTTDKPAVTAASAYADGKAAIARKDWKAAIASLTKAAELEPKNADVHNLLGYSYRKSGDYKNAFKHYQLALTINPKHKGALEYQGEAYAETGEITKAKANLTKLKAACGNTTCEEYVDLNAAIKTAEAKKAKSKKTTKTPGK